VGYLGLKPLEHAMMSYKIDNDGHHSFTLIENGIRRYMFDKSHSASSEAPLYNPFKKKRGGGGKGRKKKKKEKNRGYIQLVVEALRNPLTFLQNQ
jgi:hypothetical protein